jgi:hypothetical protein
MAKTEETLPAQAEVYDTTLDGDSSTQNFQKYHPY